MCVLNMVSSAAEFLDQADYDRESTHHQPEEFWMLASDKGATVLRSNFRIIS